MTVTLADVAARAQVSPATVSRVLNGNYPVAASTRVRPPVPYAAVHTRARTGGSGRSFPTKAVDQTLRPSAPLFAPSNKPGPAVVLSTRGPEASF